MSKKEETKKAETAKAEEKKAVAAKDAEAKEQIQSAEKQEAQSSGNKGSSFDYKVSYQLEDQRTKDAQKDSSGETEGQITDGEAVKTDGTANVNADKGLPTTPAQVKDQADEDVKSGEVENPHIEKTLEERLGLANPDDRLAEELREAKLNPTFANAPDKPAKKQYKEGEVEPYYFDVDDRTDDITFPDGAQKAQDRKDAGTAFSLAMEKIREGLAEAERSVQDMERLSPRG